MSKSLDLSRIDEYIERGMGDRDWYKRCEALFVELFGTERLHLVCQLFAATSINTSLKSNITLFRKALYEMENGLPIGNYLPNIRMQLERIRAGQPLSGRKIRAFAAAMSGDPDAVVVDIWLLRAFGMERKYYRSASEEKKRRGGYRSGGATDRDFTLIERWVRHEANHRFLYPAELSAIIWAGTRIVWNGDRETHYEERLRHHLTNLFNVI